jgi:glycosyltransferase involved in cell wall biosynthesis
VAAGEYDLAICHNLLDLRCVAGSGLAAVLVFHTSRQLERAFGFDERRWKDVAAGLARTASIVFVSPAKQESWDLDGRVILPGIDMSLYGGYEGDTPCALHVGNLKRELASVSGLDVLQRVVSGLPLTLRGLNPHIPGSRLSAGWDELRETMRTHRLYVNATQAPFEDGYNLAMLEAMATGMPVVTTAHPTSPIVDGVNGYVSGDVGVLRERVLELLEDPARACALGAAASTTVSERFPLDRFRRSWRDVITEAAAAARSRAVRVPDVA